jgi:hypothetical protein
MRKAGGIDITPRFDEQNLSGHTESVPDPGLSQEISRLGSLRLDLLTQLFDEDS